MGRVSCPSGNTFEYLNHFGYNLEALLVDIFHKSSLINGLYSSYVKGCLTLACYTAKGAHIRSKHYQLFWNLKNMCPLSPAVTHLPE